MCREELDRVVAIIASAGFRDGIATRFGAWRSGCSWKARYSQRTAFATYRYTRWFGYPDDMGVLRQTVWPLAWGYFFFGIPHYRLDRAPLCMRRGCGTCFMQDVISCLTRVLDCFFTLYSGGSACRRYRTSILALYVSTATHPTGSRWLPASRHL